MNPVIASDVDDLVRRFVRPGEHLHLAATQSRPNALTYALCRQFGAAGRFTISTTAIHTSAHALTIAGAVRKVIAGFVGDTYPSPGRIRSTATFPRARRSTSKRGRCSATCSG